MYFGIMHLTAYWNNSMKTLLLFSLLIFHFSFPIFPQMAQRLEQILERPAVDYQEAVLLVLEATDRFGPDVTGNAELAFNYAMEQRWLPGNAAMSTTVNFRGLSLLIMRAFEIRGGVLFSITRSQHHAYRELVYRSIIQGRTDPQMAVSGEYLLFTLNRVFTLIDNDLL